MSEDQLKTLKKLSIAYQSALEYDYCPESKKARAIKKDMIFAEKYSLSEIKESLDEFSGNRPDEIANEITSVIDSL